jgi:Protein tyrosine and serine/threonine kinase
LDSSDARDAKFGEAGALVGGRYRIQHALGPTPYGETFRALDPDDQKVTLKRVRPELVANPDSRSRLHAEIARAASLDHEALVKPIDFVESGGDVYIVSQAYKGQSLRAFLAARTEPLPFADAAGVVLNICAALAHAAPITYHGGLIASHVILQTGGRVKITELGLARALPLRPDLVEPPDLPALAPELRGKPPRADALSDVYAIGSILFELCTGRAPAPGLLPRSVNPALPADIDPLMSVLLATAPDERLTSVAAVGQALSRLISATDAQNRVHREREAARVSKQMTAAAAARRAQKPAKVKVTDTEARWLIHKGKLDYGPYNLAELRQKIVSHEVVPGDIVIDQELGKRAEVEAHPLLHDLVAEAGRVRQAHGEAAQVAIEKKRGAALYAFIALGVIALGAGGYGLVRVLGVGSAGSAHMKENAIEVANVGGIKVGTARHTDDREAQRKHRAQGSQGPRSQSPGRGGDAFDDSTSFDMGGDNVGDERLDDSQINGVLGSHADGLARCLKADADRGGARRAEIDFIVLGSGRVSQARVNGDTGTPLAGCVKSAMQSLSFPSFNGPRTKASFSMSL